MTSNARVRLEAMESLAEPSAEFAAAVVIAAANDVFIYYLRNCEVGILT